VGLWHSVQRQVTADLLAELPFFQGHIFNSRMPTLRRDLLPCARIYTGADQRASISQMNSTSGYLGVATLTVQVTVEAAADPAASDLLDLYCEAVEIKLLQSQAWLCNISLVTAIDTIFETDVQGEMRTTTANINFLLKYAPAAANGEDPVTGVPVITDTNGEPLGDLESVLLMIDVIDPAADPNTTGHPTEPPDGYPGGYPGPDGRIEVAVSIPIPPVAPEPNPPTPRPDPPGGSGITTRRVQ